MKEGKKNSLPFTRESVERYIEGELHRGRSSAQPSIYLVRRNEEEYVLKDAMRCPALIRWTFGRWVIQHEYRVCRRLGGIRGIPRVYGLLDDYALIMERLEAQQLPHLRENFLTPEFFVRLKKLLSELHARGIAHGDLRRKNVLVNRDLEPCIIDFATAFTLKANAWWGARLLFWHYCKVDNITVLKMQKHYFPESLTQEEEGLLAATPLYLRLGRFLKKKVYRPLKPRHRKEFWRKMKSLLGLNS
jgi:hypothetical protein